MRNGDDPMGILEEAAMTEELTAEAVRQAANRYFDMTNQVKVVLYPETRVADEKVSPGR